jgi:hypothetical protein
MRWAIILLASAVAALGQIENPPTSTDITDATATGRAVLTASNAAAARSAIGLGATNSVTFGGVSLNSGSDTGLLRFTNTANGIELVVAGSPRASFGPTTSTIAGTLVASNLTTSGTLTATGNITMSGTANTAPNQTAASGSSIMTRDLVDARMGNPEATMNMTYWFGLQGLGNWITAGTSPTTSSGGLGGSGLGFSQLLYTTDRIGINHAGAAIQSPPDNIFGGNAWRPSDGGNVNFRLRVSKPGVVTQPAFAFILGNRLQSSMWAVNGYGLYYVPQPTNSWTASTAYSQHDKISVSNVVWAVNTAGTTDTNAPTWTDLIGSLVTNGTAVFRNCGPHTSNNWVLALGHTNASQVVMTNTGVSGWTTNTRARLNLKLRGVKSSPPYTIYGSVETGSGESAEVSLSHSNNTTLGPQMWQRWDGPDSGASGEGVGIHYIGIQGTLPTPAP